MTVRTRIRHWLYANRYTWLLAATVVLALAVVVGLAGGIRYIQDTLPIETLHKQRDFSALMLDLMRLEHSVELLASEPEASEVDDAVFQLDVAYSRARDNLTLYGRDDVRLVAFHQDLKRLLDELSRLLERLSVHPVQLSRATAWLAQPIEQLHAFHAQAQQINDEVFQASADQITRQRNRLEGLRLVLLFGVGASAVGTLLLIVSLLRQKQAFERLQKMDEEIRNFAFYDHLTGLANRRLLMERLTHAQTTGERSGLLGAVLFIDLDRFKTLNDTEGHDTGDRLLVQVAERLLGSVRGGDTVARFGGDEFLVLLENLGSTVETAAVAAERIAEDIREVLNQPFELNDRRNRHFTSPSIGIALFEGREESVEMLLKQADLALYQAKDAGRDTVRFFSPSMQAKVDQRFGVETALRGALAADEFQLYLQPIVTASGDCVGAEALIRWRHPERGLLGPGEFIDIAEESGLIVLIGSEVLRMAFEILRDWSRRPLLRDWVLSVNVSAKQFRQRDFVQQIQSLVTETGVPPQRLKLELTETVVLHNLADAQAKMQALRALGVGLALDDFGTGYSSLTYLKQLPFTHVKIDKSFVRDIGEDQGDEAICSAVIYMAHQLGLKVVAEGVETQAQSHFLTQTHRCDWMQGYLFGKPQSLDQFEQKFVTNQSISVV